MLLSKLGAGSLKDKIIYEELARTPRLSARKVAQLLSSGHELKDIRLRFGRPIGQAPIADFLTPACPAYPEKVRQLFDPPLTLFHRGLGLDALSTCVVGVVGSRKASKFGIQWARRLGASLARRGVSVCSGLAQGIDGACHRGALEELSRNPDASAPIGVLGHGWGRIHPTEHYELARQMEKRGLLVTEYPPGFPPARWTFPARNRIIAALSDHVVVVEAGKRSGSLYTAEFALELGRTVWILPNTPGRPNSEGVLGLWRAGAEVILDMEEFVNMVCPRQSNIENSDRTALNRETSELLWLLAKCEGVTADFCRASKLGPNELAYRLAEMEIEGLIRRDLDGSWTILRWDLVTDLGEKFSH